jgi:exodeoxyribonuclease V alpha subunit
MAERLIAAFGERTLEIIEETPEVLFKIKGIGKKNGQKIYESIKSKKDIQDVMVFLRTHYISQGLAVKIYKIYGNGTLEKLKENPYQLADDVQGIGFATADKIALSLGFASTSSLRLKSGIVYTMSLAHSDGHVYLFKNDLITRAVKLLQVSDDVVEQELDGLLLENKDLRIEEDRIYAQQMLHNENYISDKVSSLACSFYSGDPYLEDEIRELELKNNIELSTTQRAAVLTALNSKISIITGGPGTGKTTILKFVAQALNQRRQHFEFAAPTGKAAKRIQESTGFEAKTIHRLLEFIPDQGPRRHSGNPLTADFIIIDESSMIDISLMFQLLDAVDVHSRVLFVGDADQLPSVGPGRVLWDLIQSEAISTTKLTRIFRQSKQSKIVVNAHLINNGYMPELSSEDWSGDFIWIERSDPDVILSTIQMIVAEVLPSDYGLDPMTDIQVLSPMKKGEVGVDTLNLELRERLNPRGYKLKNDKFRLRDKVMQIRNDYENDVFNGDSGTIVSFDHAKKEMIVEFDSHRVSYKEQTADLILSYAITIHKSQGSEYPAVVVPVSTQHYIMLQRNLIYTALTRGKRVVCFVGSKNAMEVAVKNSRLQPRNTYLGTKIRQKLGLR